MPDKSRLGLAIVASFDLVFLFYVFCPVGWDIGDVVSYSSTSMGISRLKEDKYAPGA